VLPGAFIGKFPDVGGYDVNHMMVNITYDRVIGVFFSENGTDAAGRFISAGWRGTLEKLGFWAFHINCL